MNTPPLFQQKLLRAALERFDLAQLPNLAQKREILIKWKQIIESGTLKQAGDCRYSRHHRIETRYRRPGRQTIERLSEAVAGEASLQLCPQTRQKVPVGAGLQLCGTAALSRQVAGGIRTLSAGGVSRGAGIQTFLSPAGARPSAGENRRQPG